MAKTYRESPLKSSPSKIKALLALDTQLGIPVLKQRREQAARRLGEYVSRFDDDYILEVATEIGLEECVSYAGDRESALVFDFTPIQLVSMCSALACCVEFWDGRVKPKKRK